MAIQAPFTHQLETTVPEPILRLENGDHLTHVEFWRRYLAMPSDIHAELIEGVVSMASPIRTQKHSTPQGMMITWLGTYQAATPMVSQGGNSTIRLDPDNTLEPDALLRIEAAAGGQSEIDKDDYLTGAPEMVVEIAASTVSNDLHTKLNVYRRNGVREYLVWRTQDEQLDWFRLREGKYERVEPDADGILRSEIFPGLWLAVEKLLKGDLAGVLAELQNGIASPEHHAFVEKLQARAAE